MRLFQVRKCINPACGLRFTLEEGAQHGSRCPRCRSATELILADQRQLDVPEMPAGMIHHPFEALLDNIRSALNVGAIFRVADGAGVARLHLCGVTPTPDAQNVRKTSLGAENTVPWEVAADGALQARALLEKGYRLWALEGGPRAEPLFAVSGNIPERLVLVVGNEISGVDPGILALCERVIYLPMRGTKGSLNVATAFAIAAYGLAFGEAS